MTNTNPTKQTQLALPEGLQGRVRHGEDGLDDLMPPADVLPVRLHEAMRYAVLGGGKRRQRAGHRSVAGPRRRGGGIDPRVFAGA
ncbi:hypothetical protein G6F59_018015 [Rhizopus arrhizus]|nr:hypothetical protein G6F59_018015 [Rhizopus arrhizus]